MMAALRRVTLVTRVLLRQNRLLLLMLLLWPCLLSVLVFALEHSAPESDDVQAMLQQELFYGLVLAGVGASVALGAEERAGRVSGVLGRAVSRSEYLLSLTAGAYLPFVTYGCVWFANASLLLRWSHAEGGSLPGIWSGSMVAGLLLCAVGVLFSTVLPQLGASVATGIILAVWITAARQQWGGLAWLLAGLVGRRSPGALPMFEESIAALSLAVLFLTLAGSLFERRDLRSAP